MDITPLIASDRQIVQSYGPGRFRISGATYQTPVLVFPDRVQVWDGSDYDTLAAQGGDFDVILIGCGATADFELRASLKVRGLKVDVMDTGAACRTYNVLMAEGRRVAVALIPL